MTMEVRLSMRKIREILRLRFDCKLTIRQISASIRVSTGAVTKYLNLFGQSDLSWPLPDDMDDTTLINRLSPESAKRRHQGLVSPDWVEVHQELKQKGMTKQLVWEEHCEAYPHNHYSYPQFCHLYREWRKKQKRSMRQLHRAGEKMFVDYAGLTVTIVDRNTGIPEIPRLRRFLSLFWGLRTTPMPKPHGHRVLRTSSVHKSVPSTTLAVFLRCWCRTI